MEKIKKIISETFRIKLEDITLEMKMEDIDSWDSLTHMELIANLESELDMEFTSDEILEMTDVAKIKNIIEGKFNGNQ